uniref:Dynein heavy chain tail domain-containing protein n=1 Tax=Biomphalaria glabrata TaxID=6526 RepID=A0A2C9KSS4_BIOGL
MQSKFRNVILQFNKEIDIMNNLFMEHKTNPPFYRNYPPVAGAIFWCRSLFHRIKSSIIRFNTMADMMSTDIGKMVSVFLIIIALCSSEDKTGILKVYCKKCSPL